VNNTEIEIHKSFFTPGEAVPVYPRIGENKQGKTCKIDEYIGQYRYGPVQKIGVPVKTVFEIGVKLQHRIGKGKNENQAENQI
jgi:hypothetical protein